MPPPPGGKIDFSLKNKNCLYYDAEILNGRRNGGGGLLCFAEIETEVIFISAFHGLIHGNGRGMRLVVEHHLVNEPKANFIRDFVCIVLLEPSIIITIVKFCNTIIEHVHRILNRISGFHRE